MITSLMAFSRFRHKTQNNWSTPMNCLYQASAAFQFFTPFLLHQRFSIIQLNDNRYTALEGSNLRYFCLLTRFTLYLYKTRSYLLQAQQFCNIQQPQGSSVSLDELATRGWWCCKTRVQTNVKKSRTFLLDLWIQLLDNL